MHLRRLRQAQSLTLAALAEQVGVTASALSQIERGTSEPSLGTLWRLGRALNASLFDFFAGQEAPTVDVTRAGDRTIVEFERFRYEVMARSAQRGIDLFTLRLEPGDGPVRDPIGHAGEEAGVVVEGTMDVVVAGVTHRLGPGDAIWFISGQPHTFVPVGDAPCLSVWADTIPDHAAPGGSRSVFDGWIAGTEAPADARTALAPGRARDGRSPRVAARRDASVARGRSRTAAVPGARAVAGRRPRRRARPAAGRGVPARGRRPALLDRVEPARVPRHRHAAGPRGGRVRRRGAARRRTRRRRGRGGRRRRLALRGRAAGARRRSGDRGRLPGRRARHAARRRPGSRGRRGRGPAPRAGPARRPRRARAGRLAQGSRRPERHRPRAGPARRGRDDRGARGGRPVLPGRRRAGRVRRPLARRGAADDDHPDARRRRAARAGSPPGRSRRR